MAKQSPNSKSVLNQLPKPFLALAPMDDVTDTVFRQIVADCAPPDLYMTEFVNVDGLQSPGRVKLLPKLQFTDKERPIIAQLWGKDPKNYLEVAKQVKAMGYNGIDINMGCPDKAVVKNGCCVALINNRELAGEIIKAVREAVGSDFPVSVKTRLGLKQVDFSWHEFLLKQKLNMLSIHGRTAKEMSKVAAHWDDIEHIRELRDELSPTTLIVGNGDVRDRAHASELISKHKLDGAMIGRGIFDDPFAFTVNSPWQSMAPRQKLDLYKKHVELFAKTWQNGERKLHTLNKFCKIYVNGFDGAKDLREKLMNAKSTDELLSLLS